MGKVEEANRNLFFYTADTSSVENSTETNNLLKGALFKSESDFFSGIPDAYKGNIFFERGRYLQNALFAKSEQTNENGAVEETRVTADSTPEELLRDTRVRAMLDVLAFAEGTRGNGDYRRVVNGTVLGPANSSVPYDRSLVGERNVLITGELLSHPNLMVQVAPGLRSSAAGRYQFLYRTWQGLNMPDFSAHSQDLAAIRLMQRRDMIEPLLNGDFTTAIHRGAPEWASLPTVSGGSYYGGQGARSLSSLQSVFNTSLRQNGGNPTDSTAALTRGERGQEVENLQDGLIRLGLLTEAEKRTGPGVFGAKTERGVESFQESVGLEPSGRFDNTTRQVMTDILLGNIRQGVRGDFVRNLQRQLVSLDYLEQQQMNTGPGIFGPQTASALREFQRDNNLEANGVFNAGTFRALRAATQAAPNISEMQQPAVTDGDVNVYNQWNVYSTGDRPARLIDGYEDLQPHHDYQSVNYVMRGLSLRNRLEARDIVLTRAGESNFGQAIPSPLAGEVLFAGDEGDGYGSKVVIRDSQGRIAMIGHLQSINVRRGENVTYGQNLGGQGATGNSSGAHIHINADRDVLRRWAADLADGRFDGIRGRFDIGN